MSDLQREQVQSEQTGMDQSTQPGAWPPAPTSPAYGNVSGMTLGQRFVPATGAARAAIGGIVVSLGIQLIAGVVAALLFLCIRERDITATVVSAYRDGWIVNALTSLAYIVAGVLFLRWFYLAYRNLPSLGVDKLYYSPVWTIVWFFVPILNLYKPYQMMVRTWRASRISQEDGPIEERNAKEPPLIACWWVTWIFGEIIREVAGFSSRDAATWANVAILEALIVCFTSLLLAAGIFLIKVIRQVDGRQLETARRLGAG